MTEQEYKRRLAELEANNAALQAKLDASKKPSTLSAEVKRFGSGTISLNGMQRFPLSFYPQQWLILNKSGMGLVKETLQTKPNEIRSAAYAMEKALQQLSLEEAPKSEGKNNKSALRQQFESLWDGFFAQAMKDVKLVPSSAKYRNPIEVMAEWM